MMRSVVKKPSSAQQDNPLLQSQHDHNMFSGMASASGIGVGRGFPGANNNMLQGFGSNSMGQYGGMGGMGGMTPSSMGMAPLFPQQARQVSFPGANDSSSFNNFSNSMGGGGGAGSGSNQGFPQGGMSGMTSKDMFEAGLRLERMEQRQQQMQQMQMSMDPQSQFNHPSAPSASAGMGGGNHSSMGMSGMSGSPGLPSANYGGSNSMMNNSSSFGGADNMSQVELASQLMKRDPSMEPWRALELAKRFNNN